MKKDFRHKTDKVFNGFAFILAPISMQTMFYLQNYVLSANTMNRNEILEQIISETKCNDCNPVYQMTLWLTFTTIICLCDQ